MYFSSQTIVSSNCSWLSSVWTTVFVHVSSRTRKRAERSLITFSYMLPFFRLMELVNRISLLKVSLEQITSVKSSSSTSVHFDFLPAFRFRLPLFFNPIPSGLFCTPIPGRGGQICPHYLKSSKMVHLMYKLVGM